MFILPFDSKDATLALVGGKGANLAELTRAGFDVPPGFFITTDAYRAFLAENRIEDDMMALARRVVSDDPIALEETSAQIRALFDNAPLPPVIAAEIQSAYASLIAKSVSPAVAVRSSATAEDLPGLSFAGQQDTYLNVIGAEAVSSAVERCWSSLWTARAISYRAHNRLAPDTLALAVVVQLMVPSEASGVLFTANPLTGQRGEMVVDASFGLGEAIVSGQVEPDHFVVDTRTWQITMRHLGAKAIAVVPSPEGGTQTVESSRADAQALPDEFLLGLAKTGQRVAEHHGTPQDIEWAWAGGKLYLLQARPITSLYPLPALDYAPGEMRVYISFNSIQGFPDPFTPLARGLIQTLLAGLPLDRPSSDYLPEAGGRLFIDLTSLVRDPFTLRIVRGAMAHADPGALQALDGLLAQGRLSTKRIVTPLTLPSLMFRARHLLRRLVFTLRAPERARERYDAEMGDWFAAYRRNVSQTHDLAGLISVLERDMTGLVPRLMTRVASTLVPGVVALLGLQRMLAHWLGLPTFAALELARGLPHNPTTEMDLKLWAAAQTIRADAPTSAYMLATPVEQLVEQYHQRALPATAQNALDKFLDEYGARGVGELDIGNKRWSEDPSSILQTLNSYLRLDDPALAPDVVFQRGAEQANRLGGEYAARIRRTHLGSLRVRLFRALYRRMRVLAGGRETPKFYLVTAIAAYREAFLWEAQKLVAEGALETAEDIFFIPLKDLKRFAYDETVGLRAIVAAQRVDYEREKMRRQLPRLLLSTGEVFYEGLYAADSRDLVGAGVSPGTAEGRVRVVLDPRGTRLEPGEILVCQATDPGWTPLFLAAGALVMEIGGTVTHGAVVAREYGIPAVVGVDQVTRRLRTGQRVRVDGSAGRVRLLPSE